MPGFLLSQNSFRKGGSVAACCVTLNCIVVSFFRSSSAEGFCVITLNVFVAGGFLLETTCESARMQPLRTNVAAVAVRTSRKPAVEATFITDINLPLVSHKPKDQSN